jgi:CO dehydrogenase/acetyl-CoA synthase gamma subunit (corrinoid Fe-S protein)
MLRILSQVIGNDPIRAVGGDREPEQFHFVVFGETLDLDDLAVRSLVTDPRQFIEVAIRCFAARVVDLAVVLEWAVSSTSCGANR